MVNETQIEEFIQEVCLRAATISSYEELDSLLIELVDEFGTKNNLDPSEMDKIQNAIYKRLDR